MANLLPDNLFFIREKTRLAEGLKSLSREKFVNLTKLNEVGINGKNWDTYETRGSVPPIHVLEFLITKFNITLDDLFFKDLANSKVSKKDTSDEYIVRIVNQKASAGFGINYSNQEYLDSLETMTTPFRIPKESLAFEIEGDSMYPYIDDGDFAITTRVTEYNLIKDGTKYIVITPEGIYLKIVYRNSDSFTLVSLNTKYAPLEIEKTDILQIWKVIGKTTKD